MTTCGRGERYLGLFAFQALMRPTVFVKLATVLLASIPFICAEPTSVKLYHRLYHPSADQASFLERGSVFILENNDVYFQRSPSYTQDLKAFDETLRTVSDNAHLALYQVALDRGDGPMGKQWDISSVKLVSVMTSAIIHSSILNLFFQSATYMRPRLNLYIYML